MKKLFVLPLFLALALAFSACGSPDEDNPPVTPGEPSPGIENETHPDETQKLVFGTATLTYAEFYSGDVSTTESFDVVTSATVSKYEIMPNMATDFVDETTNANGYHITGVKNVNIAVSSADLEAYQASNNSFVLTEGGTPAQYKTVTMKGGQPVYSATQFNIADTVTDATAELQTGTVWGDYQINVTDGASIHLRNTREDTGFDIGSGIQGIILETDDGLKVGMEYLQSIWVQPYEVSFNVPNDNTHNAHISGFDNLPELAKLVGKNITKITYIMQNETYVYEFDGIYIKPLYSGSITATVSNSYDALTLSTNDFSDFKNGKLTVTYTLGSGRNREVTTLLGTDLISGTAEYSLDITAISGLDAGGTYSALITSDSFADVAVSLPISTGQRASLEAVLATAKEKLATEPDNSMLAEHIAEAEELLANEAATSSEASSLIGELNQLTAEQKEGQGGGQDRH